MRVSIGRMNDPASTTCPASSASPFGAILLASQATDVGSSNVELPIDYAGEPVEITFDPRYLSDALKTLEDTASITAELIDAKNAAVFKTEDQYTYVVMPLTRDS